MEGRPPEYKFQGRRGSCREHGQTGPAGAGFKQSGVMHSLQNAFFHIGGASAPAPAPVPAPAPAPAPAPVPAIIKPEDEMSDDDRCHDLDETEYEVDNQEIAPETHEHLVQKLNDTRVGETHPRYSRRLGLTKSVAAYGASAPIEPDTGGGDSLPGAGGVGGSGGEAPAATTEAQDPRLCSLKPNWFTIKSWNNLICDKLKAHLKNWDLCTRGKKADLINRLQGYQQEHGMRIGYIELDYVQYVKDTCGGVIKIMPGDQSCMYHSIADNLGGEWNDKLTWQVISDDITNNERDYAEFLAVDIDGIVDLYQKREGRELMEEEKTWLWAVEKSNTFIKYVNEHRKVSHASYFHVLNALSDTSASNLVDNTSG